MNLFVHIVHIMYHDGVKQGCRNCRKRRKLSSAFTMGSDEKITLKLLINTDENRVVLAESDKGFVDILLSFLTMPMGTIARLLGKDSSVGCISNLYKSAETLDNHYLQTEACRAMLLHPLNAADLCCERLAVNINDMGPRKIFICQEPGCYSKPGCFYSSIPGVRCSCGKQMSSVEMWEDKGVDSDADGVFVKGGLKFIISDDLRITPLSTTVFLSLLDKLSIEDGSILEERVLNLGPDEILNFLRRILVSKSPLTDLCFNHADMNEKTEVSNTNCTFQQVPKSESDGQAGCHLKVKLLSVKNSNKVAYMEGGEQIVNHVFSFLTLPLGSVIKLLDKNLSMGCVDNLYDSVEKLSSQENDCLKSELCKTMLISPKLPPFFSWENQLLKIDETVRELRAARGCYTCFRLKVIACSGDRCLHGVGTTKFEELNPKFPNGETRPGGGYAKGPCKFMVTDDLSVVPLSTFDSLGIINEFGVAISDLVETEVSIGKIQALNLLKAAMTPEMVLTKVFCPRKQKSGV